MNLFNKFPVLKPGRKVKPPDPRLYHFKWVTGTKESRVHLRIDEDDSGLLIVNANRIYHLNPSATQMAYYVLNQIPTAQAVLELSRRFKAPSGMLENDFLNYQTSLTELLKDDTCPLCDLELETTLPFNIKPSAPYRMDLALTYRCNNNCSHCYNARSRNFPEIKTKDWFTILDRLWELKIPHIVFTGGEPTLREDLPELIKHAEGNGQITGLNTNGRRLSDPEYLQTLIAAGLDHVQITLESHIPEIHDRMVAHAGAWDETVLGIRNAVNSRLFVMTNSTMLSINRAYIPDTLRYLGELGVPTIGLNALIKSGKGKTVGTGLNEADLQPLLSTARTITEANHQRLIWYTPTEYCNFDPVLAGFGVKGCTAALYNMCLEPDGSVLPCQSYYQPVGNLLTDDWNSIWNHKLCQVLRERKALPEKCSDCLIRNECGGGCPLTFEDTAFVEGSGGRNES